MQHSNYYEESQNKKATDCQAQKFSAQVTFVTWLTIMLFKCHLSYWVLQSKRGEDVFNCLVDVLEGEDLAASHVL